MMRAKSICDISINDAHKFSHCALIVRPENIDVPNLNPNHLYIIAIDSDHKNIKSNEKQYCSVYPIKDLDYCVHLKDLDLLLKSYASDDQIYIAPLKSQVFYSRYDDYNSVIMRRNLSKIFHEYQGKEYEWNWVNLLLTFFPSLNKLINKSDKLICSEFVAIILIQMGFLHSNINVKTVLPIGFIGYHHNVRCIYSRLINIDGEIQ